MSDIDYYYLSVPTRDRCFNDSSSFECACTKCNKNFTEISKDDIFKLRYNDFIKHKIRSGTDFNSIISGYFKYISKINDIYNIHLTFSKEPNDLGKYESGSFYEFNDIKKIWKRIEQEENTNEIPEIKISSWIIPKNNVITGSEISSVDSKDDEFEEIKDICQNLLNFNKKLLKRIHSLETKINTMSSKT
jgi:hypothetical protein